MNKVQEINFGEFFSYSMKRRQEKEKVKDSLADGMLT
jgi:hypothetical protein